MGALGDKLVLELSECREDAESETTVGGGHVDLRASTSQDFKFNPAWPKIRGRCHQMAQITVEPVQLPDDERASRLKGFQQAVMPGRASCRPEAISS